MKTVTLSMIISAIVTTTCCGQAGILGIDTTGAGARFEDLKREGDFGPIERKRPISRPDLLSADERWSPSRKNEFAGTLAVKKPTAFKVGDWGCASCSFRVLNKVSENECLALPKFRNAEPVLLRGFDLSKVNAGAEFVLRHPVVIQETYDITSAEGSKQTALVLDRDRFDAFFAAMQQASQPKPGVAETAATRDWTDSQGKVVAVSARFLEFRDNRVHLKTADDEKVIEIAMSELSREDRQWIRDELKRRRANEE